MEIGAVKRVDISDEMQVSYLSYAMSVIVARALPDARDGLKPVHRRILYAMYDMGLRPAGPFKKSARIVGECFARDTLVATRHGLVPIQDVCRGDHVYTQSGIQPVLELYEMPSQPLHRVELENGLYNVVTPAQTFRVLEPDLSYSWKEARDLTTGDWIVLRAAYPSIEQAPRLPPYEGVEKRLTAGIAYLLGFFTADGWVAKEGKRRRIGFGSTQTKIIERVVQLLRNEFGYEATIETQEYVLSPAALDVREPSGLNSGQRLGDKAQLSNEQPRLMYTVRINYNKLNDYLTGTFGLTDTIAPTKQIPALLFQSPKDVLFAFLSGLVDGDGYIHITRNVIHYGSVSLRLIDNLQVLLHHLGFPAHRYVKDYSDGCQARGIVRKPATAEASSRWQTFHWLELTGTTAQRLAAQLDLAHPAKRATVVQMIQRKTKQLPSDQIPYARIKRVLPHEPKKTFDVQVADEHSFIANGMVVHNCLGKYHPHGDQAVYDAMVRMAQDFSMRYLLVDGQGNFGSIDGDPQAAMRYTEARMTPMSLDLLQDIRKGTVDFAENFDSSLQEPLVLPASVPNLLVNGASGIAVGMSTSVPPHNLGEVVDALIFVLDHWARLDDIGVKDLMQFIHGPDFPTGGIVYTQRGEEADSDAIAAAYATGRGRVTVRARVHVEEMSRNRHRLVVTELPYQVNKAKLLERIAELHREERIDGITDLRDESDRNGMRVIIELTRTVTPKEVLDTLFKLTPMQITFSIIMLALVNGEPRLLALKKALYVYLEHRLEVIQRRGAYDLAQAQARAHILAGFLTALDNLDAVIDTIRRSRTAETAHKNLRRQFKFSYVQARAVLDMPLRRLAALERKKIQDEYREKLEIISYLEGLLSSPKKMRDVIKHELLDLRERYADQRRTQIVTGKERQITTESLLPDEMVWVTLTQDGFVARTTSKTLPKIGRKPAQLPQTLLEANTRDTLYLITAAGKAVSMPVHQLPQSDNLTGGSHFADLSRLTRREHVSVAAVLPPGLAGFLTLCTVGGVIKRVDLQDLPGVMSDAFVVMSVPEDDRLAWGGYTGGGGEMVLSTACGRTIRFKESDVRPMGLSAGGVMGIRLKGADDGVVGMAVRRPDPGLVLWVIADNGFAKYTALDEYPLQKRYGQGVITQSLTRTARMLAGAVLGRLDSKVMVITTRGISKMMRLKSAPQTARTRQGERVMDLAVRDQVAGAVALVPRPAEHPSE